MKRFLCALMLGAVWLPAHAALNVLACEPEWSALATEIGGEQVSTGSATTGEQDPHRIEARPSLIARVRNADLLVCTGLELENGWLPVLLAQSGNPRVQPGQAGFLALGPLARLLESGGSTDRARGDVHAAGNPHVQLDPRNIAIAAEALARRLAELDPAHATLYASRQQDFAARWDAARHRWEEQATPLRGVGVITHHRDMVYLIDWLGMREIGNLEPKPGLEPSSFHLTELLQQLQQQPARLVLRTPYQDARASEWLAEKAGIEALMIPTTVGGSEAATDLFTLYDDILGRLLGALG